MARSFESLGAATRVTGVEQLRDIHGIDGVPWWPPAPGWWWLLGALTLILLVLWRWRPRRPGGLRPPSFLLGSWRRAAARELRDLRRRLPDQPVKQSAAELSELLRRIAMARYGRAACAGLTGVAWLRWLSANDPSDFDWEARGRILLAAPYAPADTKAPHPALAELIDATEAWVGARSPEKSAAPHSTEATHGETPVV